MIRERFRQLAAARAALPPVRRPPGPSEDLYGVLPADHRLPYRHRRSASSASSIATITSNSSPNTRPKCCAPTRASAAVPWPLIANRRGFLKSEGGPRIGGIVYTESARKVAYFVENAERARPAPHLSAGRFRLHGRRRSREPKASSARAPRWWRPWPCATVPKIILTINHASGAGYYAMAGQGFDPNFTFSWPTARIGVMEGDSAVQALFSAELEKWKSSGQPLPDDLQQSIEKTRADYERWLDARYAAARGHVRRRHRPARLPRGADAGAGSSHAETARNPVGRGAGVTSKISASLRLGGEWVFP